MAVKKLSQKIKMLLVLIAVVGGSLALQRWANIEETITVDGQTVSVIDGDSFKDATAEYRIYGIDAPEYRQTCKDAENRDWPCGKSARTALAEALRKGEHNCDVRARDQYGRMIVSCWTDDRDLGASLVEYGHAISSDNFDQVIYGREEARAEKFKRGIWQGSFEKPASWRASHPR